MATHLQDQSTSSTFKTTAADAHSQVFIGVKCTLMEWVYKIAEEKVKLNPSLSNGFYLNQREINLSLDEFLTVSTTIRSPSLSTVPGLLGRNHNLSVNTAGGRIGSNPHRCSVQLTPSSQSEVALSKPLPNPSPLPLSSSLDGNHSVNLKYSGDCHGEGTLQKLLSSTEETFKTESISDPAMAKATEGDSVNVPRRGSANVHSICLPRDLSFYIYPGVHTPLERGVNVSLVTGSMFTFLHVGYLIQNYKTIDFVAKWLTGSTPKFVIYSGALCLSAGVGLGLIVAIAIGRLVGNVRCVRISVGELLASRAFCCYRDDGQHASAVLQ